MQEEKQNEQILTCDTDCHFEPVFHIKGAKKQIKMTTIKRTVVTTLAQYYYKPPGILRILNGAIGKYIHYGSLYAPTASKQQEQAVQIDKLNFVKALLFLSGSAYSS